MLSCSVTKNGLTPFLFAALALLCFFQQTLLIALFLLFIAGYLFVTGSTLLFGRMGMVISMTATIAVIVAVIISQPIH